MSVETKIIGFITHLDRDYNQKVLQEVEYKDWDFVDMFCSPKESGAKGPDYIFFGADHDYLDFDEWLNKFENILKKLKAFKAFLFVDKELDRVFIIGYNLYDGQFEKEEIDLGREDLGREDLYGKRKFPLLFEVIKHLKIRPTINNVDDIWGRDDETI